MSSRALPEVAVEAAAKAITVRANIRTMQPQRFTERDKKMWADDFARAALTAAAPFLADTEALRAALTLALKEYEDAFVDWWPSWPDVARAALATTTRDDRPVIDDVEGEAQDERWYGP